MAVWHPQRYRRDGQIKGVAAPILDAAIAAAEQVTAVNPLLPPIFTLRHLAHMTGAKYGLLRMVVSRRIEDPYRVFRISKRPSKSGEKRFRVICAPDPTLLTVQRWIAKNILAKGVVHSASTAYAPDSKLVNAVSPHCGCRWLIKLDIKNFFESVTEISVYRAYLSLGYQPLLAFELARLSTRLGTVTQLRMQKRWRRHKESPDVIGDYVKWRIGHLPQGAPTSPMLANLAMLGADKEIFLLAAKSGLTYTRYADDLTFSTLEKDFDRAKASAFIRGVYGVLARFGFSPNTTKAQIVPPRARKVVLGLLVDGDEPRLTRAFRANLRMHLYYLAHPNVGPAKHAASRGFTAVAGLRNHLEGLIAYARQVDPEYGARALKSFKRLNWSV